VQAATLPRDLQTDFDAAALKASLDIQTGRFDDAASTLTKLYEQMLQRQPAGTRYHKGFPLHNIGYALVRLGRPEEALRFFLLAYIEDLLTQNPGEEDAADGAPASQTLRLAYRIGSDLFDRLKNVVREKKKTNVVVQNPEGILSEFASPQTTAQIVRTLPEARPSPPGERRPGQFSSSWEKRVFVGGGYREFAILNEIKRIAEDNGFDAILVADFQIPGGLVHHHSLMLLHECRAAIFDLSSEAGQLMEIERLRDYGISETLLVYQDPGGGEPKITEMLGALLTRMELPPKPYEDLDTLRTLVRNFLSGLQ
jgi:tetratricopeptide (TPR) repeat protein